MTHQRPRPLQPPPIRPAKNARPRPTTYRNVAHVRHLLQRARAIANERRADDLPPPVVLYGIQLMLMENRAPWRARLDPSGRIHLRFPVPAVALDSELDHEAIV